MTIETEEELDAQLREMLGHTTEDAPDEDTATEDVTETSTEPALAGGNAPEEPEQLPDTAQEEEDALAKKAKAAERKMHEATQAAAELRKQNAAMSQRLAELEAAQKPNQAGPDDDGIAQVMEDFPELAAPLIKQNKALEAKLAKLEAKFGEVSQTTDTMLAAANEKALESKLAAITAAHPDANDVVMSDDFADWKAGLPPMMAKAVSDAIDYAETKDVIMALDLFKQSKGVPVGPSKEDKLAAAKAAATPSVASRNKPQAQTKTLTREQLAKVSAKDFMADDGLEDLMLASLQSGSLR